MIERPLRPAELRRRSLVVVLYELRIVWPILSGLAAAQLALGFLVGLLERWPFGNAAYFTFIAGLTIGYGDLIPSHVLSRVMAVIIGFIGILLTGLVAAIGVQALRFA